MGTITRTVVLSGLLAGVVCVSTSQAAQRPERPPSCRSVEASHPGKTLWEGFVSGSTGTAGERKKGYSARGCFLSKAACEAWVRSALTYVDYRVDNQSCRQR